MLPVTNSMLFRAVRTSWIRSIADHCGALSSRRFKARQFVGAATQAVWRVRFALLVRRISGSHSIIPGPKPQRGTWRKISDCLAESGGIRAGSHELEPTHAEGSRSYDKAEEGLGQCNCRGASNSNQVKKSNLFVVKKRENLIRNVEERRMK